MQSPWDFIPFLLNPHHPHEDRTRRPNDPNETKATTMAEMAMTYLTKAQDLVPATYGYYALVSALCVVGLAKVAGVMAHPGSKLVGRAEICGAILLLMGPASLNGLGHIFACWAVLVAMGMMLAIKPKSILTEAVMVVLTSKVLRSEWAVHKHEGSMTQGMSWENSMAAAIGTGYVVGAVIKLADTWAPNKAGGKATPNKSGKRTKRA